MKKRLSLKISGDVQGVSFRYYVSQKAGELGLTGWVANSSKGTVVVVCEGEEEALEYLVDWSYHGPSLAKVDNVDADWGKYQGEFSSFDVKYNNL